MFFLVVVKRSHQEFEGNESVEVEALQREFALASRTHVAAQIGVRCFGHEPFNPVL
jgi:hypothetical protein